MKKTKNKIVKPTKIGLFLNEPAEVYHAEAGFISSSPLPLMELSPAHFFNRWNNGVEPTQPMDDGTFLHSLVLEQNLEKFVARPQKPNKDTGKLELVRSNSKEYAEFLAANEGKTPISPELFKQASEALDAACSNKTFMEIHTKSKAEVSIYAIDEETGLPLKARTDLMPAWLVEAIVQNDVGLFSGAGLEDLFIHDYKTTGRLSTFKNQIFVMGYDVRLFHYWHTIRMLVKQQFNIDLGLPHQLGFTAMEQSAPFGSKNFKLKPFEIQEAAKKHRQYLNTIAACLDDNNFPGYSDEWTEVERPAYLQLDDDLDFTGVG